MKKSIIRIALSILLIMVLVLIGCKNNSLLTYRQIKADYVGGKIKKIVKTIGNNNGIYLCMDGNKVMYLMLNGLVVKKGEKAPYFSNVVIKPKGNVLNISYKESYTKDYINKKINNKVMYRIKLHKQFQTIKIFKNGKESHFDGIYL